MGVEIRVPALGESITEATIGRWFKQEGEVVKADEPVVELETDKVTVEVPAPAGGVLTTMVKEGETIKVGGLLGSIATQSGAVPIAPKDTRKAKDEKPKAAAPEKAQTLKAGKAANMNVGNSGPAVQRLAAESGVAPPSGGSGKDGRTTKGDMLAAIGACRVRRTGKIDAHIVARFG
jgi:2-oxoglutarate dehydrogenase E2 component (dihydrolipoamide succinyltransferase)